MVRVFIGFIFLIYYHIGVSQEKRKLFQSEGFSLGYQAHFGGLKEFKHLKQFYNIKRPWLENEMSESVWMNGFELGYSATTTHGGMTVFNFGFATRKDVAKGTYSGESFKRTVRTNLFTLDVIDVWWTPIHVKDFNLGFGSMPVGVMWYYFNTKLNGEKPEMGPFSDKSFSFTRLLNDMDLYSSFHLDIGRKSDQGKGFVVQFFYFLGWPTQTTDLIVLNQELNPSTYFEHSKRSLLQHSHFGLKTRLFI